MWEGEESVQCVEGGESEGGVSRGEERKMGLCKWEVGGGEGEGVTGVTSSVMISLTFMLCPLCRGWNNAWRAWEEEHVKWVTTYTRHAYSARENHTSLTLNYWDSSESLHSPAMLLQQGKTLSYYLHVPTSWSHTLNKTCVTHTLNSHWRQRDGPQPTYWVSRHWHSDVGGYDVDGSLPSVLHKVASKLI